MLFDGIILSHMKAFPVTSAVGKREGKCGRGVGSEDISLNCLAFQLPFSYHESGAAFLSQPDTDGPCQRQLDVNGPPFLSGLPKIGSAHSWPMGYSGSTHSCSL